VAGGTAALFLLTLIFGVQVWAGGSERSAPELVIVPESDVRPGVMEIDKNPKPARQETLPQSRKAQPQPDKEKANPPDRNPLPPAPDNAASEVAVAASEKPVVPKAISAAPAPTKEVSKAKAIEPVKPTKTIFRRRNLLDDEDLRKELVMVPVFQESDVASESRRVLAAAPKNRRYTADMMPNFAGLSMRMGVDCQFGKEHAENLQALSRYLRIILATAVPKNGRRAGIDPRPDPEVLRKWLLEGQEEEEPLPGMGSLQANRSAEVLRKLRKSANEWLHEEAVPALVQLLMAENKSVRLLLVELLAKNKHKSASVALAQRALYDLSAEVREAAVMALKDRPREEYRNCLMEGFRYPWAPVADHAAEALVALEDRDAVPELVNLLDKPDPAAPFKPEGSKAPLVREMVRINHLGNCTLCHARSLASTDPVRGLVPARDQPLPSPGTVPYYEGTQGSFIRADVTYLRQDFSVFQPVSQPGQWPANQRFDYVVRTRPQTLEEQIFNSPAERNAQRSAVLFVLRELTGRDAGGSTAAWRRLVKDTDDFGD
jgi:hypothetical protein